MEVLALLVLLPLTIALWVKVNRLEERHQDESQRLVNLGLELDAARRAFHARIKRLEQQPGQGAPAAAAPEVSPAAAMPPVEAAPVPPSPVVEAAPEPPVAQPDLPAAPPPVETPPTPFEPPPPAVEPPPEPRVQIDWEQWIGVRGAALAGGIVLALAATLFLQYSIEHEFIPPIVRVAIGLITGVGCVAGSEILRRRGYATTANAIAGAGVVILYASTWAARALYELIGPGLAFGLMILTTLACGLLSWRHAARDIAFLGLAGGFATPVLLSTDSDNPIGLFAYVLMLDAGVFALARSRRWPILVALGLGGTTLYQLAWILGRMESDRYGLGLAILGVFSAFFVLAGSRGSAPDESDAQRGVWRSTQAAGILIPFAFALFFAANADIGPHLYPAAILMAILCVAAAWLGRMHDFEILPACAAAASLGVVSVWLFTTDFGTPLAWEAVAICVGLALVFHVFFELEGRVEGSTAVRSAAQTALIPAFGFLVLTAVLPAFQSGPALWPWMCAWGVLSAFVVRQSSAPDLGLWRVPAAGVLALGFAMFLILYRGAPNFPSPAVFLALAALACVAFQLLALRTPSTEELPLNDAAAATMAVLLLFAHVLVAESSAMPWWLFLSSALLFAFLAVLSATRMPSGKIYFASMALASLSHAVWSGHGLPGEGPASAVAIGIQIFGVVLFTFWPFLAGPLLLRKPAAVYAAALAGPAWFFSLQALYELWLGRESIGVVPVVLAAISLLAVQRARSLGPESGPALRPLVWFAAVALSFLALAIPLQLEKEWITIGWAVQAVAILALWKRLDHPGLKYFALALLAAISVRLLVNPEVLVYHGRAGLPILNWLAYTYLVPAAALLASAYLLRELEIPRLRPGEHLLYQHGRPAGAILCSLSAIFVVFLWINLTIFDFYSTGPSIEVSFDRMAARDLTLSLAWALYALVLLGIGFKRDTGGLRWLSLAFLMLTIGKVFLHDLGELEDLYRVASLVGLALSLILVSLAYQRFVFRKSSS